MEIEAFKEAKRRMEDEIRDGVLAATCKFWGETGYTPHVIHIDLHEKIATGSKTRQYVVGKVSSEVEL